MAEIIGSAAIEIKAQDKNFEKEVRRIASKIKKVEIPVDAVLRTTAAQQQLKKFRMDQQSQRLQLYARIDVRQATKTLDNFVKKYTDKGVDIKVNVDMQDVYNASEEIDNFEETYNNHSLFLGVEVDDSISKSMDRIKESVEGVNNSVDDMGTSVNKITMDVDTASTTAKLAATTAMARATRRALSTPIKMNIDKETLAGIKGFFYTLTGSIPIDKVKSILTGISANFEGIAVKAGSVSSAVTAMVGTLTHGIGDLLTIGGDVTEVVGILAAAPAGIAAGGLALTGTILGWKGFGEALTGEGKKAAEAMKLLPPEAQKAVKALDGVGASIRRTTQTRYWDGMGTAVQDVMGAIRKDLDKGMGNAGQALGGQMSAIFGAVQEFGESGGLSNTFRDLTEFFKTSTPALTGFTAGFLDLMEGGARDMPVFGTWLSKLGTQFGAWAKNANETGLINEWIGQATQRMQELWSIGGSTIGVFSGLTNAARNAGMNGLTDLAFGMESVNEAVSGEGFQKGLTSFFQSARKGAENSFPGIKNFFDLVGRGVPTMNTALEDSGTIVGNMFNNLTRAFSNGNMGKGFLEMLSGMKDATASLEPGFESLGNALGGAMEVAGEVVRNVAPGLNELFSTIDVVVNGMKEGIIDAMPVFNEFIQGLLSAIKLVVGPLANLAGAGLTAFANLPGVIQTAAMALGTFLLLSKRFPGFMTALNGIPASAQRMATGVANSMNTGFVGPMNRAQTATRNLVSSTKASANQIQTIWANNARAQQNIQLDNAVRRAQITKQMQVRDAKVATAQSSGVGGQMLPAVVGAGIAARIGAETQRAAKLASSSIGSIGKTAGVVGGQITKSIGGGLMGALGGPWGLAITGAVAGLALLGQSAAEQKQKVEDLYQSLGKSGEITSQTTDKLAEGLLGDKGTFFDQADAFLGFQKGGTDVSKTLDKMGISTKDVAGEMTTLGEDYQNTWSRISDTARVMGSTFTPLSGKQMLERGFISDEDLDKIGRTREEVEKLNGTELSSLGDSIEGFSGHMTEAQAKAKALAKTITEVSESQIADNKMVLESQVSSVDEKLAAFKSNLQLGGLEQLSAQAGFYQLGQVTEQNNDKLTTLRDGLKETGKTLSDTFNVEKVAGTSVAMFDMTSQAGRQMFEVVGTQADAIHSSMISTYDSVLKETDNIDQAQQAAFSSAKDSVAAFTTELKNAGLETDEITQILDNAGLSETDIKLALKTEGINEAVAQAMEVEAAMRGLQTGDWSVSIDVMSDDAKSKITDILGLAESATSQEITQKIRAQFDNSAEYQSWMTQFGKAVPEQKIKMLAELNADSAITSLNELTEGGKEFNGKTWKAALKTTVTESGATIDQINSAINSIPPETLAKITAKIDGDPKEKLDAILGSKQFKAEIEAILKGDPEAEIDKATADKQVNITPEIKGDVGSLIKQGVGDSVKVPLTPDVGAFDFRSALGLGGAGGPATTATIEVTPKVAPIDFVPPTDTSFDVKANVDPSGLDQINATISGLSDKTVNVNVIANETGLGHIKSQMESLTDKTVSAYVNAGESGLGHVKSQMDGLTDKTVSVSVNASESGLGHIKSLMDSVSGKVVSVTVSADAGPVQAVKTALDGVTSKVVGVIVLANAAPATALKAVIDGINSKMVAILALAPTGAVDALRKAIDAVKSKVVAVMAITNTGAVQSLVNAIGNVRSKTVTVTAITRQVGSNADGGMYSGNVRTFAKGGFDDPRIAKAIERAQRRGGKENHTAQIARGSNNFRIWGEPETQGEAYIPLAPSKRARSMKILEQVASHFGVSLEKYADGGFLGGSTVSDGVTSFASGGTTTATKKATAKQKADSKAAAKKASDAAKKLREDIKKLNETIRKSISDLKKAFTDGLSDLKTAFGAEEQSPVKKALGGMRTSIREFKNETNKSIKESKKLGQSTKTLSAQVKGANKLDKVIAKQRLASNVWNRKGSNLQDSQYIANDSQRRQRTRAVDYNSRFTIRDYELALGHLEKELEKQESRLENMKDNHVSNMEGISSSLFSGFDMTSLVKSKDDFGYRPPTSAREISAYASNMLADMKLHGKNISALRKAGYNEAIINQIANMSLEDGLVVAKALLSDKSQMKSINSSFTQMYGKNGDMNIDAEGNTYIGGLARKIGWNGADAMFKAGVNVQKGLVKGLTDDVKAVEKSGQVLADALVKSFKKALKIKSPSRVFESLGKFIPQGLTKGIDSEQRSVDSSISNLVRPSKLNFGSSASSSNSSGIINGRQSSAEPIVVNVHPSPGMSEYQVGMTAAREIHYRLDSHL